MRVGVVADTHGLVRPRVEELLAGCDRILHAGDVGAPEVLERLGRIAPVAAVRGNVDLEGPLGSLPVSLAGDLAGLPFRMTHRREDVDPAWPGKVRLVVFGHSHRPELSWRHGCLLLNPGACGRRRFHLPLTLAILTVADNRIAPEILAVG
jgi:uncharacterized protein